MRGRAGAATVASAHSFPNHLKEGTIKFFTITAVLAASLLGPTAALAMPADQPHNPDLRSGASSSSLGAGPATGGRYEGSTFVANEPVPASAPATVDLRSPDALDAAQPTRVVTLPAISASPASSGFDWGDAAVGAAMLLGAALLSLLAFLASGTARRHHSAV